MKMVLADIIIWINDETSCYARDDGSNHILLDGTLSVAEIKELARMLEDL